MVSVAFAGLDLLATAVVALDERFVVRYANPAAESLLDTGAKSMIGQSFPGLFTETAEVEHTLGEALNTHWDYSAQAVSYVRTGREPLPLSCIVTRIDAAGLTLLAELRPIEQQLRLAREERMASEQQANRELIRNLAHEIRILSAGCVDPLSCSSASSTSLISRNTRRSSSRRPTACKR